jgi:lipopolysaccharide export system permease protein
MHRGTESGSIEIAKEYPRRWRFPVLNLYVFKVILYQTLAVGSLVFFALALERVLRLVQVVTRHGASAHEAWGLIVYLIPHYLGLAVPAGFFFGVMLGIRRLHERSELVVMRSFGVSMSRLFIPVGALAALLTLAMLALTIWVQPHARYLFRNRMNTIISSDVLGPLAPGVFLSIGADHIVRTKMVRVPGKFFEGFFMARQTEPGLRDFLTATTAEVLEGDASTEEGALDLMLLNGILIREKDFGDSKSITLQFRFEEMRLSILTGSVLEEPGPRGRDERELTAFELVSGRADGREPDSTPAQMGAELHWRIVQILSLPVLGALALPLALIGQGRSARASGLALGLVVLVLFEKTARLGKVMAESERLSPWIGLWVPWFALIALAMLAHRQFSGDRGRPDRDRKLLGRRIFNLWGSSKGN